MYPLCRTSFLRLAGSPRFFEAVQKINSALELFENDVKTHEPEVTFEAGQLMVDPVAFSEMVTKADKTLGSERREALSSMYETRAEILIGLGGLRRAAKEYEACTLLTPYHEERKKKKVECDELFALQEKIAYGSHGIGSWRMISSGFANRITYS